MYTGVDVLFLRDGAHSRLDSLIAVTLTQFFFPPTSTLFHSKEIEKSSGNIGTFSFILLSFMTCHFGIRYQKAPPIHFCKKMSLPFARVSITPNLAIFTPFFHGFS
jgi:hypothetical protein